MPLPETAELKKPQQQDWTPIPEDVYQVQITGIDLVKEKNNYKEDPTDPDEVDKMKFEFTVIEEGEHYGRKLWQRMSPVAPCPSRNNKHPWIWKIASALAGHPLTQEEGDTYTPAQINGFIGKQLRATVTVSDKKPNGKQYNNIESFLQVKAILPAFDPKKVKPEQQTQENQSAADNSEIRVEDVPF